MGSIGDASTLLPLLASDSASFEIAGLVYNGLVSYDKDLQGNGRPGRILGDLRGGPGHHLSPAQGGEVARRRPFTAADVLYTYQIYIDPKTPTAYAGDFLQVKKAEVLDD